MTQAKYLNIVLTLNAILLALLLLTQLAGGSWFGPRSAAAQSGMPNAAQQRQDMIRSLNRLEQSLDRTHTLLEEEPVRVNVMNLDQVRPEAR